MKHTLWLFLLFLNPMVSVAQSESPSEGFLAPQNAQKSNPKEEQLYSAANDALNNGNYDSAISGFDQVAAMKGRRADGALYWKAYALNKSHRQAEALATIAQLRKEYPQSAYRKQAEVLEVEMRPENPEAVSDDEMKLIAIDSLMQTDPDKALTILEKVFQGNSSSKVKDRALFVLAQNRSDRAQQLLLSIAKGSVQPELQSHAIKWLAVSGRKNSHFLPEIYSATTSADVKKQVLKSFIMNGDKEGLLNIIRQEKSPELRREGIRQLGPMGARSELQQLYKQTSDAETKETLLQAMGVAGDWEDLIEIAKTETNPEARARAIRNVGVFGGRGAGEALVSIYNTQTDIGARKEVIRALFIHGSAKEMVDLARKETNPELKKEVVRNLSIMHSPEATEYMMEILNK